MLVWRFYPKNLKEFWLKLNFTNQKISSVKNQNASNQIME